MASFLNAITGKKDDKGNNNNNQQQQQQAVAATKQVVQHNPKWTTRMGQCDPPATMEHWLLSCFCFHCATAAAKARFDGSHPCYNCLCWHHIGASSWIRKGYAINGTCGDDMMCGLFCTPCAVRRFYTEIEVRGAVPRLTGGPDDWQESLFGCGCCEFFQALLCPFCTASNARVLMQPNTQIDSCFDYMCLIPFSAYGQARHMYGIRAEFGICDDIFLPVVCYPCAVSRAAREAQWRLRNAPQCYAGYGVSQAGGTILGMLK